MPDNKTICDAVNNAVRDAIQAVDPSTLVTKSLVIYEFMDEQGHRKLAVWPSEDSRWWDVQGMAGYAYTVAEANIHLDVARHP